MAAIDPQRIKKALSSISKKRAHTQIPLDDRITKRLRSYTSAYWFAKPASIKPLICARMGWKIVEADTLECESCSRRLKCPSLPTDSTELEKIIEIFLDDLKRGHRNVCPYFNQADMAMANNQDQDVQLFESRIQSYIETEKQIKCAEPNPHQKDTSLLPEIDMSQFETKSDSTENQEEKQGEVGQVRVVELIEKLERFFVGTEMTIDTKKIVATLGLLGWRSKLDEISNRVILECDYCHRVCGLWNFLPFGIAPTDCHDKHNFNPESEHRWFCEWIGGNERFRGPKWSLLQNTHLLNNM